MKNRKIALWVLIVLITLGVGIGGVLKLIKLPMFVANAESLNYSVAFSQFIGLMEIIGSIGLYIKKYRIWAALGIISILIGAIGVSVGAEAGIEHHIGPLIPLMLCVGIISLDTYYTVIKLKG